MIKDIFVFFGGAGLVAIILFLNPEKVEKWSVLLWKVIYFIFKKGEKQIITHDIQGRINEFAVSLKKDISNYEPVGIKIQWITEKESPSEFFEQNRLIIRMRQHANQNKNFVGAAMLFISKVLLTKTKKYLSPTQRESIDLFVGRKLLEKEKPQIVDRFFEDFFSPKVLNEKRLMELEEKYEVIDKVGLFFPVLIQELTFLGEKVFFGPKSEIIITEVNEFIDFLKHYADREVGDQTTPTNFEGAYCRCGIIIIAKRMKLELGKIEPFLRYMETLLEKKLENIYLIGFASDRNIEFINKISDEMKKRFGLQKYMSKRYKAKIKLKDARKEVDNYLVLHKSPNTLRYYDKEYQEKYVAPIKSQLANQNG